MRDTTTFLSIALCSLLATACGAGDDTASAPDADPLAPDAAPGSIDAAPPEEGAPRFLSFGSNVTVLRDGDDLLTLTAVLTDPDGVEDLIGGQLVDVENGATLGAFATAAQEGSYTLTLSWMNLTQVRSDLPAPPGAEVEIQLRATFFDEAGHEVSEDLTVRLGCPVAEGQVWHVGSDRCYFVADCGPTSSGANECDLESHWTGDEICEVAFGTACVSCHINGSPRPCSEGTDYYEGMDCTCG